MELKTENISVKIGDKTIIDDINVEVSNRRFVGIVGPNGSGKSTLLKTIYRVLPPAKGAIYMDGKPLSEISLKESARNLGVMTQTSTLNFDFKVEEVVLMGRTPHKKLMEQDNKEDYRIAHEALEKTGMRSFAKRKYNTLSGGERQRVLFARALAQQPKTMILDEPTNHLDIQYQLYLLQTLKSLDIEVFAAMHDLNLALTYCDFIYVMNKGHIAAKGEPSEILTTNLLKEVFEVEAMIGHVEGTDKKNIVFLSSVNK